MRPFASCPANAFVSKKTLTSDETERNLIWDAQRQKGKLLFLLRQSLALVMNKINRKTKACLDFQLSRMRKNLSLFARQTETAAIQNYHCIAENCHADCFVGQSGWLVSIPSPRRRQRTARPASTMQQPCMLSSTSSHRACSPDCTRRLQAACQSFVFCHRRLDTSCWTSCGVLSRSRLQTSSTGYASERATAAALAKKSEPSFLF